MELIALVVSCLSLALATCTAVYTYWRSRPRLSVHDGRWAICDHARAFAFTLVNNSSEMISVVSLSYVSLDNVSFAAELTAQPVFQRRLGGVSSTAFPVVLQPFEAQRVIALFSGDNEIPDTSEGFKHLRFITSKNAMLSVRAVSTSVPYTELA